MRHDIPKPVASNGSAEDAGSPDVINADVREKLIAMDEYICSRLRSSSSAVLDTVWSEAEDCVDTWSHRAIEDDTEDRLWPKTAAVGVCENKNCGTEYRVEYDFDAGCFTLGVDTKVDWCTVTDEKWLAKVEVAAHSA